MSMASAQSQSRSIFTWSVVLYAVVFLPILQTDRLIADDWGRTVLGYAGWITQGRPLTELLMWAANLGSPMVNFAPVPQIGALLVYAFISVIIARRFKLEGSITPCLIVLILLANPLTLRNISHKLDALPISCSVLCAFLPLALADRESWLRVVGGFLALLGLLTLYQASLNVFLVFTAVEVCYLLNQNVSARRITLTTLTRAAQLIAAICVYWIIAKLTVQGPYAESASRLARLPAELPLVLDNLRLWWGFPADNLPRVFRLIGDVIIISGLASMVWIEWFYIREMWAKLGTFSRLVLVIFCAVLPLFWLLGSSGFLIALANIRLFLSRVYAGFGATLASALLLTSLVLQRWRISRAFRVGLLLLPAYLLIYFVSVYSNAQREQKRYEEMVATRLVTDLLELRGDHPFEAIFVQGNVGYAPVVGKVGTRFKLIRILVGIDLNDSNPFLHAILTAGGVTVPVLADDGSSSQVKLDQPPLRKSPYYTLYLSEKTVVVVFEAPNTNEFAGQRASNLKIVVGIPDQNRICARGCL
jgi:hypothetical protein